VLPGQLQQLQRLLGQVDGVVGGDGDVLAAALDQVVIVDFRVLFLLFLAWLSPAKARRRFSFVILSLSSIGQLLSNTDEIAVFSSKGRIFIREIFLYKCPVGCP